MRTSMAAVFRVSLLLAAFSAGVAGAQPYGAGAPLVSASAPALPKPTLTQIYALTHARRLDHAQVLMRQLLDQEPGNAQAHFVQAELFARRSELERARVALDTAQRLAPGLPFARPESVQALRSQTSVERLVGAGQGLTFHRVAQADGSVDTSLQGAWWTIGVVGAGLALAALWAWRRPRPPAPAQDPADRA